MDKPCRRCGVIKPIREFARHQTCKGGYDATCKECRKEKKKAFIEKHPGYKTMINRRYRERHPEDRKKRWKIYYGNNIEKRRVYREKYYRDNEDYWKQYSREHYRQYPEIYKFYHQQRRARESGGDLRQGDFGIVCVEYGNVCLSCGSIKNISLDHIVPISRGGVHSIMNIQPLCRSCNSKKGTKTIDYRPYVPKWLIGSITQGGSK